MARIFTIGETLLDIFFKDGQAITSRPGGAMLNTAISLGRLDLPIYLISEYGNDQVGDQINHFLHENGVQTDYIYRYESGRTSLAMAFLDDNNEAKYSFYKQYPEKRLQVKEPKFTGDDIILFGSFYSLLPEVRAQILHLVRSARSAGALILYDPNIRSPHRGEVDSLRDAILENFSLSDIVRGSDEDFSTMFNIKNHEEAFHLIKDTGCQYLIYTMNKDGVYLLYDYQIHKYRVPSIETVSTVGAGDSFNAGLIFAILKNNAFEESLRSWRFEIWSSIIEEGISFSADVCQTMDNYISLKYASRIKDYY